jgi:tRNA G18 (ribose-2'-O)-methylase SpoU
MDYIFLQCRNEACRFRFPAERTASERLACPRCQSALVVAAGAAIDKPAPQSRPPSGRSIVALLDNIRSIHNVGSMFRSADGAGVSCLHLAGITATPDHPKLKKAALGAQETVGWVYHLNAVDAAETLRVEGYRLVALERLSPSGRESLFSTEWTDERLALVLGNERAGVDPGILALCDAVFALPMIGRKSSLNAAVAFGIAVYYLRFGVQLNEHETRVIQR